MRKLSIAAALILIASVAALVSMDEEAPRPGTAKSGARDAKTTNVAQPRTETPRGVVSPGVLAQETETREPTALPWTRDEEVAAGLAYFAKHDPARFRRFMEAIARDPAAPVGQIVGALASVGLLPPSERTRFRVRIARGLDERVRALEESSDAAAEVMERRGLGEVVREAIVREVPEAERRALALEPTTAPDDRLLLTAAAVEHGEALDPAFSRALGPVLLEDLRAAKGGPARLEERRVSVIAALTGEARDASLVAAVVAPGLSDLAAHAVVRSLAATPEAARAIADALTRETTPDGRARLGLAFAAALPRANLARGEREALSRVVVASLESCVASRADAQARRLALSVLIDARLAGANDALARLAAGGGAELADEARAAIAAH